MARKSADGKPIDAKYQILSLTPMGFTLVEVMIAMVLFGIGIMALSSLCSSLLAANAFSTKYAQATVAAQDKVEHLQKVDYDSVVPGKDGFESFTRTWNVRTNFAPNYKAIRINVSWNTPKGRTIDLDLGTIRKGK